MYQYQVFHVIHARHVSWMHGDQDDIVQHHLHQYNTTSAFCTNFCLSFPAATHPANQDPR